MKRNYFLPLFLTLIIFALIWKQCDNKVITANTKRADVQKSIDSVHNEIKLLKPLEKQADSVRVITKWKYRTLHDTIPCEIKLVYCDSVIFRDSISISYKDSILVKYDSLFPKYQLLAKIDSMTIDSLTRSKKKFWKGFKVGYTLGLGTGIIGGAVLK